MHQNLTRFLNEVTDGASDPYGTVINISDGKTKEGREAINIYLTEPGTSRKKMLGSLSVDDDGKVIYYKTENESDKHRNTFSWTITKWILPFVDEVIYETDFAIYTASVDTVHEKSFFQGYKNNNQGYMSKVFLKCIDWTIECKDARDQKRVDLLGYEWYTMLKSEFDSAYMQELGKSVANLRKRTVVYPENEDIFNAFKFSPYSNVKVVIVGQDPYHDGCAHGLAFSIRKGAGKIPPSLQNIVKEVEADYAQGFLLTPLLNLEEWARQGVFLINTVLTVEKGHPASHSKLGWQQFTKAAIKKLLDRPTNNYTPLVFMLWGKHAQQFEGMIDHNKHLVLKAPHPSPFSAHTGFLGCKHFTKCNEFLANTNQEPIRWA